MVSMVLLWRVGVEDCRTVCCFGRVDGCEAAEMRVKNGTHPTGKEGRKRGEDAGSTYSSMIVSYHAE